LKFRNEPDKLPEKTREREKEKKILKAKESPPENGENKINKLKKISTTTKITDKLSRKSNKGEIC